MSSRITVTGGAGYVGRQLVSTLRAQGQRVRSLDIAHRIGDYVDEMYCDVTDPQSLAAAIGDAEVIFHLAGPVAGGMKRRASQSFDLQLRSTQNVLDIAAETGAWVVLASSFYVYSGISADGAATEKTPLDIMNTDPFGAVKLMSERLLHAYADAYGLKGSIARIGSVYGPGPGSNVVSDMMMAAESDEPFVVWGKGARRNQFTYIQDVVDGLILLGPDAQKARVGGTYNLISPEVTTTSRLAWLMGAYGVQVEFDETKPEAASFCHMYAGPAHEELGWSTTPLDVGLGRTWKALSREH